MNRKPVHILSPLLFYTILFAVFTYPLFLNLDIGVAGDQGADLYFHTWGFWWTKRMVLHEFAIPFFTNYLNFPDGGYLYCTDLVNALLSIPLQMIFSLEVTYNLMIYLNLVAGAISLFSLMGYLGAGRSASFIAGALYAFNPFVLSEMNNGVLEAITIPYLPLYILFFIKVLRGEVRFILPASLFFSLTAIAHWYYGMMALFLTLILFPLFLLLEGPSVRREGLYKRLTVFGVESLLLVLPFAILFYISIKSEDNLVNKSHEDLFKKFMLPINSASADRFFPVDSGEGADGPYEKSNYLGVTFLLLLLSGLALNWRMAVIWLPPFLLAILLSLGPYLTINLQHVKHGGGLIPLPYLILHRFVPFFSWMIMPCRFHFITIFTGSIIAGIGASRLFSLTGRRIAPLLLPLILAGVIYEYTSLSGIKFPVTVTVPKIPEIYGLLKLEGEGGVVELPLRFERRYQMGLMMNQTLHGKKIIYRPNDPFALSGIAPSLEGNPFFLQIAVMDASRTTGPEEERATPTEEYYRRLISDFREKWGDSPPEPALDEGEARLRKEGVKYFLLNRKIMRGVDYGKIAGILAEYGWIPLAEADEDYDLFRSPDSIPK